MKAYWYLKNKEAIISEWKKFIANDFFGRKEFENSLCNHAASAFYDPKKVLSKKFYKRIISCLLPESLERRTKEISSATD